MLQFMGSQRVRHDLATEQQTLENKITVLILEKKFSEKEGTYQEIVFLGIIPYILDNTNLKYSLTN